MNNQIKQIAERLKGLRDALDLSSAQIAEKTGISLADYEKYESGNTDIPMSFLFEVAKAFHIELSSLISGDDAHMASYFVTRKGQGIAVERTKAYKYRALASGFKNAKAEPFFVTVEPNNSDEINLNTHPTQEFNLVTKGKMLLRIAGKDIILEEGDSIYFDASKPHGMKALNGESVRFLAMII
ncbi:MAG: XRE family transcriptional regulator [Prevotellaceae bacterium]|jgi:transcriptional regulator with XRE-family HTH domain|nr:XRE family transcriptional regulator [Prevotellaceae bacterium]